MDIFTSFATDEKAEVEGRWFPLSKTASILVARNNNPRYKAALRKGLEKNRVDLDSGGPEADYLAEQLFIDVQADTVLLDWKGLSFQGKDVVYSPEMSRTLLRVKDFAKKVNALSDSMENFRVKGEEAAKND